MNRRSQDRAVGVFRRITPTILQVSDIQTAELIKLLDNSFRDLFFGFGNEVALLCEAIGADATEVIKTANLGYERTNIAWPGIRRWTVSREGSAHPHRVAPAHRLRSEDDPDGAAIE